MAGFMFTLQVHSSADVTDEAIGHELGDARLTPVERATLLPTVTDAARRLVDALGVPCTVSVSGADRLAQPGELTTLVVSVTSSATVVPESAPAPDATAPAYPAAAVQEYIEQEV